MSKDTKVSGRCFKCQEEDALSPSLAETCSAVPVGRSHARTDGRDPREPLKVSNAVYPLYDPVLDEA